MKYKQNTVTVVAKVTLSELKKYNDKEFECQFQNEIILDTLKLQIEVQRQLEQISKLEKFLENKEKKIYFLEQKVKDEDQKNKDNKHLILNLEMQEEESKKTISYKMDEIKDLKEINHSLSHKSLDNENYIKELLEKLDDFNQIIFRQHLYIEQLKNEYNIDTEDEYMVRDN